MYLTTKEVLDLKSDVMRDLDDFEYGRGHKRIPILQGEDRTIMLYVLDLLDKILKMLKRGNYDKSRILEALECQDWVWYSHYKKALWSERLLKERMQMKPTKKIKYRDLILMQAKYLERASQYIIDVLGE